MFNIYKHGPVCFNTTWQQDTSRSKAMLREVKEKKYPMWKKHTADKRAELGMSAGSMPWTGEGIERPGVPECERIRQLINVAWHDRLKKFKSRNEDEAKKNFFAHVCQSVHFNPWGQTGFSDSHSYISMCFVLAFLVQAFNSCRACALLMYSLHIYHMPVARLPM